MKYIRTKDGNILSLNEFKYEKKYHWYSPNEKYLSRLDIGFTCWHWCFDDEYDLIPNVLGKIMVERIKREECKFANNIEELCDKFVLVGEKIAPKHSFLTFEQAKFNFKSLINQTYVEFAIYGAIWTDKGLIYVAKMNDKGVLELL